MKIKTFSEYCKEVFGTKVYRLSLSTGCSCPNRDGTKGYGGCNFCSEKGAGEFTSFHKDIDLQIEEAKQRVDGKFPKSIDKKDRKYIAYFQSFTNTYGKTETLREIFEKVLSKDEIVAISIATRPDCLEDDKIQLICNLNKVKPVWIELGLQTIHDACAKKFNRGYDLVEFENAYKKLKEKGIAVIVHVILGLPYETREDSLETVRYLAACTPKIDGIKLHLLHVLKNTRLAKEYEKAPFPIMNLEEYASLVVRCLSLLPEGVVVHRMTGDGDRKNLIEPKWTLDKKRVLNTLNKLIREYVTKEEK